MVSLIAKTVHSNIVSSISSAKLFYVQLLSALTGVVVHCVHNFLSQPDIYQLLLCTTFQHIKTSGISRIDGKSSRMTH